MKYENLEVGREVELKGILYDKNTQKPIMIDGKEVTASAKFTPEEASGTAQVEFKFDATSIAGKTAVAFEEAYDVKTGTLIGSHKDIDDSDQTVNFLNYILQQQIKPTGITPLMLIRKSLS